MIVVTILLSVIIGLEVIAIIVFVPVDVPIVWMNHHRVSLKIAAAINCRSAFVDLLLLVFLIDEFSII